MANTMTADERTRQGFRALHGELKDLKRRFAMLNEATAEVIGNIDAIIAAAKDGRTLNREGLVAVVAGRNNAVKQIAEALGSTPEEIAGGLLSATAAQAT